MTYVQLSRSVLCAVILLVSAAGSRAELAPDAQQAISKGIIAARQQDYLLAIRYFQDARKIAPDAPEIYYDLGLAESKIPGCELGAAGIRGRGAGGEADAAKRISMAVNWRCEECQGRSHRVAP